MSGFGPGMAAAGYQDQGRPQQEYPYPHQQSAPLPGADTFISSGGEISPSYTSLSSSADQYDLSSPDDARRGVPDGTSWGTGSAAGPSHQLGSANQPRVVQGPEPPPSLTRSAGDARPASNSKSKRVRTGCLTCRERHLKCDEAMPECLNCRKSHRECKRGIRLNFLEVNMRNPPMAPSTQHSTVSFQDESRQIASEYRGGLGKYAPLDVRELTPPQDMVFDLPVHSLEPNAMPLQQPTVLGDYGALDVVDSNSSVMDMQSNAQPFVFTGQGPIHEDRHDHDDQHALIPTRSGGLLPTARPLMAGFGSYQQASISVPLGLRSMPMSPRELYFRSQAHRFGDSSSSQGSLVQRRSSTIGSTSLSTGPTSFTGLPTPSTDAFATGGSFRHLQDQEEMHFMGVFIADVAVWMDSIDHEKHFGRIIPYEALESRMLLNAFLACGAMHLYLTEKKPHYEERALFYYTKSTTELLERLADPDRNIDECAVTATVLNTHEIMSESFNKRISHIAGSRALIRESGWDARSTGVGAACFWLNIGMELYTCLGYNWQTAWDPDQWGMDLTWMNDAVNGPSPHLQNAPAEYYGGVEEVWVHRMFYITAKMCNFKANKPRFQDPSAHEEQIRRQTRYAEWKRLKNMCDWWNAHCPRGMQPFAYQQRAPGSHFPQVWLLKRAAIVGRIHYHLSMCILAQINPLEPKDSPANIRTQVHHCHQICGIVTHSKDKGAAGVAIRSTANAAAILTDRSEQEEVLQILETVGHETGWRLAHVLDTLKVQWGWVPPPQRPNIMTGAAPPSQPQPDKAGPHQHMAAAAAKAVPFATINPVLANADFSNPHHPYKGYYQPPRRNAAMQTAAWQMAY